MSDNFHPALLSIPKTTDLDNKVQNHFFAIQDVLRKTKNGNLDDTIIVGNGGNGSGAGSKKMKSPAGNTSASKIAAPKHTTPARSSIAQKAKFDRDLKDLYKYLLEKKSAAATARTMLGYQKNTKVAKQKMKAAEQKAVVARKKMSLATRDSDIANINLILAAEEVKQAEQLTQTAKAHRPYQPTEEGFQRFKVKVLQMEISSDDSN